MMSRYKTINSIDIKNLNHGVNEMLAFCYSNKGRKGIRFQFRNLLSIRLSLVSSFRKGAGLKG
jgi:hypothetical protein